MHEPDSIQNSPTPQWRVAMAVPQFRWLLWGNLCFFLAMQGQMLTRTFLAWELTGREMALASINLSFALPMFLVSIVAGAISDRVERRRLVILAQTVVVANEAFVLGLLLIGVLEFWHMLVAAVVGGAAVPFIFPARMALVFAAVGPGRIGNALALSGGVMNLSRVLGPALMGFVVHWYTVTGAFALATALYLLGTLCMLGVAPSRVVPRDGYKPLFADIAYGFRYVAGHPQLRICLAFGLLPLFLAMPVQNLLVVFADEIWQVGERGLGVLLATAGMGGVLGSLWVAQRGENPNRVKIMVVCSLVFGVLLAAFAITPHFLLALVPLLLANLFASASQTLNNTAVQLLVDDAVRGRMAAMMMMAFSLTPLGVLPLAFASEQLGAPTAVMAGAAVLVVLVVFFYMGSTTLRRMDHSVKQVLRQQ